MDLFGRESRPLHAGAGSIGDAGQTGALPGHVGLQLRPTLPSSMLGPPAPRPATRNELLRAHDAALVDAVERSRGVPTIFDADTRTSAVSVDAALRAAGAAIDLATQVTPGEAPPGIALVRPPGHHATRDRVMGFCLFNNVAVAARALQAAGLAERVAIFATAPGWFARTRSRRRKGRSRWVRPSRGRGVRSDFGHPAKSGRITHEA
jgi:hypothetical protein